MSNLLRTILYWFCTNLFDGINKWGKLENVILALVLFRLVSLAFEAAEDYACLYLALPESHAMSTVESLIEPLSIVKSQSDHGQSIF